MAKILIVGTAPYDRNCQSRAFESYFHGIPAENLAQIFSYPYRPPKGHCGKLYQMTDAMMLKRFFSQNATEGIEYRIEDLNENDGIRAGTSYGLNNSHKFSLIDRLYRFGKKDWAIIYLLRCLLWKKSSWCTEKLNKWLDEFKPDCVFLSFSDDFFIPRIALYVAEKYNIPIISSIADDYYFNDKKSISPLYYIYRYKYKKLIRKILKRQGSTAIYIGDRIKEQYNSFFNIKGITLYLTSDIQTREFRPINKEKPVISYYGNIRLGRNFSLMEIGKALYNIDNSYRLNVYSNENDPSIVDELKSTPGIVYHGSVPYNLVQKGMIESDILVIVEAFDKNNINTVKYSISTKVPDSLATGAALFAYGDEGCGAIDYLQSLNALTVCTKKDQLGEKLVQLINDTSLQEDYYKKSRIVMENNHRVERNALLFQQLLSELMINTKGEKNES